MLISKKQTLRINTHPLQANNTTQYKTMANKHKCKCQSVTTPTSKAFH